MGSLAGNVSSTRSRSAVAAHWPPEVRPITIAHIRPADAAEGGDAHDLAIGVDLVAASGQLEAELRDSALLGELALDG
ncbi:MAG: magnesium chelatase domain-containing protein [Candidatus Limnocylindria bacterium]